MYLVDTSVWLDFFRNRSTQAVARFEETLEEKLPYGITSVIYQEVLQVPIPQEIFQSFRVT